MNLFEHALVSRGTRTAFRGTNTRLSALKFLRLVADYGKLLRAQDVRVVAMEMDNGPAWLALDLAAHINGIATVPIAGFFTSAQVAHAMETAGVDTLVTWRQAFADFHCVSKLRDGLYVLRRDVAAHKLPGGTAKVTFTSGTTGEPKGVCLSSEGMERVAQSIALATSGIALKRHLCLLPLPVLLENVAGAWVALLRGAEVCVPRLSEVGWNGSSGLDIARCVSRIQELQPDTVILLPQILCALVDYLEQTNQRLGFLKFAAVGGARTAPSLLFKARELGIPVYEGYGLSECASVVSLNLPGADRPGSVGRTLDIREVRLSGKGELLVRNQGFLGYAGSEEKCPDWLPTGDIGKVDEQGFWHIHGRCKNLLITGYGRNLSPEWVEAELLAEDGIVQVVVMGEGWPQPGALIAAREGVDISAAVENANARLPDYARIGAWRAIEPIPPGGDLMTANGRPRRVNIEKAYLRFIREMENTLSGPRTSDTNKQEQTVHEVL